jgi:hypothetical protein
VAIVFWSLILHDKHNESTKSEKYNSFALRCETGQKRLPKSHFPVSPLILLQFLTVAQSPYITKKDSNQCNLTAQREATRDEKNNYVISIKVD